MHDAVAPAFCLIETLACMLRKSRILGLQFHVQALRGGSPWNMRDYGPMVASEGWGTVSTSISHFSSKTERTALILDLRKDEDPTLQRQSAPWPNHVVQPSHEDLC